MLVALGVTVIEGVSFATVMAKYRSAVVDCRTWSVGCVVGCQYVGAERASVPAGILMVAEPALRVAGPDV